jgi:tRNA threonylcarbamoyladenosine modification (KEOPS) complex  Pcc1 subunit
MKGSKIIIEITFENEELTKAFFNSINVDNVNIPKDLEIKTECIKNKLIIIISSENIKRFQSTIDEILRIISSSEKTLKIS